MYIYIYIYVYVYISTMFYGKQVYRKKSYKRRTSSKRENVVSVQAPYKLIPQPNSRRDLKKLKKNQHPYKLRTRLKTYIWSY